MSALRIARIGGRPAAWGMSTGARAAEPDCCGASTPAGAGVPTERSRRVKTSCRWRTAQTSV